jgi:multidrug resistance efflux pump
LNLKFFRPTSAPYKFAGASTNQSDEFVGAQLTAAIAALTAEQSTLTTNLEQAAAAAERARYDLNGAGTTGFQAPVDRLVQRLTEIEGELLYLETALSGLGLY